MSIDRKAAVRLENVIAMLSSPNDGERANAALMATRMLKEFGLDWRQFTRRAFKPEASPVQDEPESLLDLYFRILQWEELSDWERGFVSSLYDRYPKPLSDKQVTCLDKIVRKYEASQPA